MSRMPPSRSDISKPGATRCSARNVSGSVGPFLQTPSRNLRLGPCQSAANKRNRHAPVTGQVPVARSAQSWKRFHLV
jgi:hypothetical protein